MPTEYAAGRTRDIGSPKKGVQLDLGCPNALPLLLTYPRKA